jgi:predicted glycosyltransferase
MSRSEPSSDGGPRVLIYCQDSFGLGHLRRNVNIAHEISRQCPSATILFVADSPLAPFFTLPANSDFVKLPTIVKVSKGDWEVHRLPLIQTDQLMGIRAQLIKETARSFRPDIVLVDHMPHGAQGELVPSLEAMRESTPDVLLVVGLRDILGAPEDIIPQWKARGAYELISKFYDKVLVYGCEDVYDLGEAYEFSSELREKIHYGGYVSAEKKEYPVAAAKISTEFTEDKEFTALVMGGGGSDAYFFMDAMLDAVRYLGADVPFNTFMLTGPFMPAENRKKLEGKADGIPVIVKRFRDDSAKILQLADLVVSMAGYNTTCEILQFASRAVVVPREGPSAEQTMRTKILHDRGLLHAIHPRDLTPKNLAEAILGQLSDTRRVEPQPVDLNGAAGAARELLAALDARRRGTAA